MKLDKKDLEELIESLYQEQEKRKLDRKIVLHTTFWGAKLFDIYLRLEVMRDKLDTKTKILVEELIKKNSDESNLIIASAILRSYG